MPLLITVAATVIIINEANPSHGASSSSLLTGMMTPPTGTEVGMDVGRIWW